MQRLVDSIWVSVLALCLCGCTNEFPRTAGGPFGPPSKSELLSPFAGDWVFDAELTYDARIAAGSSEEEIERLRNFFKQNPQFGQMHGDMSITGNVATCSGLRPAE